MNHILMFLIENINIGEVFKQVDIYNPQNTVEGNICFKTNDFYGSILIDKVNDREVPQCIMATPKVVYPFDRKGEWLIDNVKSVHSYLKYDGTNIYAFSYKDVDGNIFTSWKTRTQFNMSEQFVKLLDKCFERYPQLKDLELDYGCGLGFELYGNLNSHLIYYPDTDINLVLLYARVYGKLVGLCDIFDNLSVDKAEYRYWNNLNFSNFETEYKKRQNLYDINTKKIDCDKIKAKFVFSNKDFMYLGDEGEVVYVTFEDGNTIMFKLKSLQVLEVHWEKKHIPDSEIYVTANNLWEISDNPTVDDLIMYLSEEWTEEQIEKSKIRINIVYDNVIKRKILNNSVRDVLKKYNINKQDFIKDKGSIMKILSNHYDRHNMSRVYNTILEIYSLDK